jgi:hypothetical protein
LIWIQKYVDPVDPDSDPDPKHWFSVFPIPGVSDPVLHPAEEIKIDVLNIGTQYRPAGTVILACWVGGILVFSGVIA